MNTKTTFTYETEYSDKPIIGHCGTPRKMTVELAGDLSLPELIEQFENFIRGIGYIPPDNAHLDYVDNDTEETKSVHNESN